MLNEKRKFAEDLTAEEFVRGEGVEIESGALMNRIGGRHGRSPRFRASQISWEGGEDFYRRKEEGEEFDWGVSVGWGLAFSLCERK